MAQKPACIGFIVCAHYRNLPAEIFFKQTGAVQEVIFIILFKDCDPTVFGIFYHNRCRNNSGSNVRIFHTVFPIFKLDVPLLFYESKPLFINSKLKIPSSINRSLRQSFQRVGS
ncbi:hypothetical protein SDC9_174713 [bioreactor metagenome]|uniref:Uncharacterized protein n=1 Tax=bioreactor metagenome TaxID=1076179 RepID=A0A645GUG1_9ZZZZ